MNKQKNVLDVFNAIVVKEADLLSTPDVSMVNIGVVTNFKISNDVKILLKNKFSPLPINTLFSKEERLNSDVSDLITKQFLHYIEVYGLNQPGLFDLVVNEGTIIKAAFINGIVDDELGIMVRKLIYSNAPIGDVSAVVEIIRDFNIEFEFERIMNNEVRAHVYDPALHTFATGDDAIRYMVFKATGDSLVIKNQKVIDQIKAASIDPAFFIKNEKVLAEVFNRFKPLLLAAKGGNTFNPVLNKMAGALKNHKLSRGSSSANAINRIARLSKTLHKPVHESVSKRFLAEALDSVKNGSTARDMSNLLPRLTIRDKFKILNLIEYKKKGYTTDSFVIRNGRVHIEKNRKVLDVVDLTTVSEFILKSMKDDLSKLVGKNILLDANVDYGLPISRKQTVGNLPFGTTITVDGEISSGVYWENAWGARDLDLSTVDINGNRTGWGQRNGYDSKDVVFSGDVTHAENGAMEFMTSKSSTYGLFVNIFSGDSNAECELVVGTGSKSRWITDVMVREKTNLTGRGSVIGFVEKNKFRVFKGMLNSRHANFGEVNPVISRATVDNWTVRALFDAVGISYDVVVEANKDYDFNLEYSSFSIDKLENLLY